MDRLRYPAHFSLEEGQWVVEFPDPNGGLGIITFGQTREAARMLAAEALTQYLLGVGTDAELPSPLPAGEDWELLSPNPPVEVALMVKILRKELGLSQQEAAARIGVPYTSYQRWEDPERCNATVKTLDRIARAFGRQLEVIFRAWPMAENPRPGTSPGLVSPRLIPGRGVCLTGASSPCRGRSSPWPFPVPRSGP